jgi:hypothetical protein
MNTRTFIHTVEGLKAYEKPKFDYEELYDSGHYFSEAVEVEKKAIQQARSAALLVENPNLIAFGHPTGWHYYSIHGEMGDPIMIGDEFPCPDNIEWEVVWQYAGFRSRQVIRLSVKQEENIKPIINELYADNGELCGYSLINPNTGETICSEEDNELIEYLRSQLSKSNDQIDIEIKVREGFQSMYDFTLKENNRIRAHNSRLVEALNSQREEIRLHWQTLIARYYNDILPDEERKRLNKIIDEVNEILIITGGNHTAVETHQPLSKVDADSLPVSSPSTPEPECPSSDNGKHVFEGTVIEGAERCQVCGEAAPEPEQKEKCKKWCGGYGCLPKNGKRFVEDKINCPGNNQSAPELKEKPVDQGESQEEMWNDVFQNYMIWQDQEPKLSEILKDFELKRKL